LTWRHAPVPSGLPSKKVEEMKIMYADPHTLFLKDIQ